VNQKKKKKKKNLLLLPSPDHIAQSYVKCLTLPKGKVLEEAISQSLNNMAMYKQQRNSNKMKSPNTWDSKSP
jgi:hypothetical protein